MENLVKLIFSILIRQVGKQQVQIDWIRAKLEKAEQSGFTNDSKEKILAASKAVLNDKVPAK